MIPRQNSITVSGFPSYPRRIAFVLLSFLYLHTWTFLAI